MYFHGPHFTQLVSCPSTAMRYLSTLSLALIVHVLRTIGILMALAASLGKSSEWAIGFFFGNVELSLELWTVISGISGFDD